MNSTPDVIERYLRAADAQDWNALASCFTDDATVVDEGNTYHGRAAIRAWREGAAAKYTFTSTVLQRNEVAEDRYEITSLLRGDFPGGEATIESAFRLRRGLILELIIT